MEIDTIFHQLAENPKLEKVRSEVKAGYGSIPIKRHVIFYSITGNGDFVNIIGVVHARMIIKQLG